MGAVREKGKEMREYCYRLEISASEGRGTHVYKQEFFYWCGWFDDSGEYDTFNDERQPDLEDINDVAKHEVLEWLKFHSVVRATVYKCTIGEEGFEDEEAVFEYQANL